MMKAILKALGLIRKDNINEIVAPIAKVQEDLLDFAVQQEQAAEGHRRQMAELADQAEQEALSANKANRLAAKYQELMPGDLELAQI